MTEFKNITTYRLTKIKKNTNLIELNKGFNGEVLVGIFEMVGYNRPENSFLIVKPTEVPMAFILTEEEYNETFDTLLTFKLNNN